MIAPDTAVLYIFVAGVAATAVWRLAGVVLSTGLSDDGPIISWVKSVSTALVAGLIAHIVIFPPGALANVTLTVRLGAFGLGIAVYFLARRHLGLGVLTATLALLAAHVSGL
ncbi:MAG: AzlD domain-containing protein [Rhodomicrobiaceae bacterium]